MKKIGKPTTIYIQSVLVILSLFFIVCEDSYAEEKVTGELKQYTRSATSIDSEKNSFTVIIPESIPKGKFLSRGDQAILGKGLEKTLYHQEHRQKLYKNAFYTLIRDEPSGDIKDALSDFDKEISEAEKIGLVAPGTRDILTNTLKLSANGFNTKYVKGSNELLKQLNKAKTHVRKTRKLIESGKIEKAGAILDGLSALKGFSEVISEGIDNYNDANKQGGEIQNNLNALKDHYINKAGSVEAAMKQYPAEMNSLNEIDIELQISKSYAGALKTAISNNKGKIAINTIKGTKAAITITKGPALKAAGTKFVTATLTKAGVSKAAIAAGGTSMAIGTIALAVEAAVINAQIKQGDNARLACV